MTDSIFLLASMKINPGKMEEFKNIAEKCIDTVKLKDKGTLQYDWFYNDKLSACEVLEHFRDSKAVLEHSDHVSEYLGQLFEISAISLAVYGKPTEELKKGFEGLEVTYYDFEAGL